MASLQQGDQSSPVLSPEDGPASVRYRTQHNDDQGQKTLCLKYKICHPNWPGTEQICSVPRQVKNEELRTGSDNSLPNGNQSCQTTKQYRHLTRLWKIFYRAHHDDKVLIIPVDTGIPVLKSQNVLI